MKNDKLTNKWFINYDKDKIKYLGHIISKKDKNYLIEFCTHEQFENNKPTTTQLVDSEAISKFNLFNNRSEMIMAYTCQYLNITNQIIDKDKQYQYFTL